MSMNTEMARFTQDVNASAELREEVKALGSDYQAIASYANDHGYNFTADDIDAFAGGGELSDDQLDGVVGGAMLVLKTGKLTFVLEW